MSNDQLKKNLEDLMTVTGWSRAELARQLDVSRPTVYAWMKGENTPSKDAQDMVAHLLERKRVERETSGSEVENLRREIESLAGLMGLQNLRAVHRDMMSRVHAERFAGMATPRAAGLTGDRVVGEIVDEIDGGQSQQSAAG